MASLLEKIAGGTLSVSTEPVFSDADVPDSPASLLEPDPEPGAPAPRPRGPLLKPATAGPVTPALKKRISGELEAYIEMMAIPLVFRDEVCGAAVHAQAKPIADAIARILARYPDLAHKFLATGVLGDWIALGLAVKPVIEAVYAHHVAKPQEETDDGADFGAYPAYRPGS